MSLLIRTGKVIIKKVFAEISVRVPAAGQTVLFCKLKPIFQCRKALSIKTTKPKTVSCNAG
jgi:hypothetical protein